MNSAKNELEKRMGLLRAEFIQRLPERFSQIDDLLKHLMEEPSNLKYLEDLYYSLHKLHGVAGSYGFDAMSMKAGEWEKMLMPMKENKQQPDQVQLDAMHAYQHELNTIIENISLKKKLHSQSGENNMKNVNILVVDDDPEIRTFLSEVLKAGGFEILEAENGESALKLLESIKPELILADVVMPGINGYDLCSQARKMGHDDIPFIFCSALNDLPERIKGLQVGADDYLVKPVNGEELLLKVNKMIEKTRMFFSLKRAALDLAPDGIMHGILTDLGVPDILQIVNAFSPTDINISLYSPDFVSGEIYVSNKKIVHAEIGEIAGKKAFYRLLGWKEGTYRVEKRSWLLEPSIGESIELCLLEGLAQLDEYNYLLKSLNLKDDLLEICYSPDLFMRHFHENTAIILNLIETHRNYHKVLDKSPFTDLETARIINELLTTNTVRLSQK